MRELITKFNARRIRKRLLRESLEMDVQNPTPVCGRDVMDKAFKSCHAGGHRPADESGRPGSPASQRFYRGSSHATAPIALANWRRYGARASLAIVLSLVKLALPTDASGAQLQGWGGSGAGPGDPPVGLTNVVAVAAGANHNLALQADGSVVAWGDNSEGQTEVPTTAYRTTQIASGLSHNLALQEDGTVVAWGENSSGQTTVPPGLVDLADLAAGALHSLALQTDGTVRSWGDDSAGQSSPPAGLSNVIAIAAGNFHSLALLSDGTVAGWGDDSDGQATPPPGLSNIITIAAAGYHSLAVNSQGTVIAWGWNADGQINVPPGLIKAVAVAAGANHSLALLEDGTVRGWGSDAFGQTNTPTGLSNAMAVAAGANHSLALSASTPVGLIHPFDPIVAIGSNATLQVQSEWPMPLAYQWEFDGLPLTGATNASLTLTNFQPAQAGDYRCVLQATSGPTGTASTTVYWENAALINVQPGDAEVEGGGSVGLFVSAECSNTIDFQWRKDGGTLVDSDHYEGSQSNLLTILNTQGEHIGRYDVVMHCGLQGAVSAGAQLTVGPVVGWGFNSDVPPDLSNTVEIDAGAFHTLALQKDGAILAWGSNGSGQSDVPSSAFQAISVSAGFAHSLTLMENRTVLAWGRNDSGESSVPAGLSNVVALSAGRFHSLALLENGTVASWGYYNETDIPAGLSNVTAIAAGDDHSLALLQDGSIVAWGENAFGQLTVPPELTNVIRIAAGSDHSLALQSDGVVVAWGADSFGQSSVPPGLSNVVTVAAGGDHSLALLVDGTVVGWGKTQSWQTGVPPGLSNVAQISAGWSHVTALPIHEPRGITYPYEPIAPSGGTVTLRARTTWPTPLNYQWEHNGVPLPTATNTWLSLINFQAVQAGDYRCVFKDGTGVTGSNMSRVYLADPTLISVQPLNVQAGSSGTASFSVAANCSSNVTFQWRKNGVPLQDTTNHVGTQTSSFAILNVQGVDLGDYDVLVQCGFSGTISATASLVIQPVAGWGSNGAVPPGLSNTVTLAAGGQHSLALLEDGTVAAWGGNGSGQSTPPPEAVNVIDISAGFYHSLALLENGSVVAWGANDCAQSQVPSDLSNVVAVAAGGHHSLALREDGTVAAWGRDNAVPQELSGIIAISAGGDHSLALTAGGTVIAWGDNQAGQATVPQGLSNIVSIAAGGFHSLALDADGAVTGWGDITHTHTGTSPPAGLMNVQAVSAGGDHSLAVLSDGTLESWGNNQAGQTSMPTGLSDVIAAAAGWSHTLVLTRDHPRGLMYPFDPIVPLGSTLTLSVKASWNGPLQYQWEHADTLLPGATNATLVVTNFQPTHAGLYRCLLSDGAAAQGTASTTVCWEDPSLITLQPSDAWVGLGGTTGFTVGTSCSTNPIIQWRKEGIPIQDDSVHQGSQQTNLTLTGAAPVHAGGYDVQVRCGLAGSVSLPVELQVGQMAALTWDPNPASTTAGYRVHYGLTSQTYPFFAEAGNTTNFLLGGLEDGTLYYASVTAQDTNGTASEYSDEVFFVTGGTVTTPLDPEILSQPQSQTVSAGNNAVFTVVATGQGTLGYRWQKDGVPLTNGIQFSGVNQPSLTVLQADGWDAGNYRVQVTNVVSGTISPPAVLTVKVPPTLLPAVTLPDGTTEISIVNEDGSPLRYSQAYRLRVEATTNLLDTAHWLALTNPVTLVNGLAVMEDPESAWRPSRFYRAVEADLVAPPLLLSLPDVQPNGTMRFCLDCADEADVLTPSLLSRVGIQAIDLLTTTQSWTALPGPIVFANDHLVIDDTNAAAHSQRFYRAEIQVNSIADITLQPELNETNGRFRLILRRGDQTPLTSFDLFNYEVLVTTNTSGPSTWRLLTNTMVLTNGQLIVLDPLTNDTERFYRVYSR